MKKKGPIFSLTILIITLLVVSVILYIADQQRAILTLMEVIVISAVYLMGMERNHKGHSKKRKTVKS